MSLCVLDCPGKLVSELVVRGAYRGQDTTILATAIPKITDQFKSLDDVGWYGSVCVPQSFAPTSLLTYCSILLNSHDVFGVTFDTNLSVRRIRITSVTYENFRIPSQPIRGRPRDPAETFRMNFWTPVT